MLAQGERRALGLAVDPHRAIRPAASGLVGVTAVPSLTLRWAAAVRPAIRARVPAENCAGACRGGPGPAGALGRRRARAASVRSCGTPVPLYCAPRGCIARWRAPGPRRSSTTGSPRRSPAGPRCHPCACIRGFTAWSAARRHHRAALAKSFGTPVSLSHITPRLHCAAGVCRPGDRATNRRSHSLDLHLGRDVKLGSA